MDADIFTAAETQGKDTDDLCDILRDVYRDPDNAIKPSLAAKPWTKACSVCAFLKHDPQRLGAETRAALISDVIDDQIEFYCAHRRSRKGLHKVCASAAALKAGAA